MGSETADEVRARLEQELARIVRDTVASDPQVTATLENNIVERLAPRLTQRHEITLDSSQVGQIVTQVLAGLDRKKSPEGFGAQLGSALNLMSVVLAVVGVAALILAGSLLASLPRASEKAEPAPSPSASPTVVATDAAYEPQWQSTLSQLAESQGTLYKAYPALTCGWERQLPTCQTFEEARGAWMALLGDDLDSLKQLNEAILKVRNCRPALDSTKVQLAADYVTDIERCLRASGQ